MWIGVFGEGRYLILLTGWLSGLAGKKTVKV